MPGMNPTFTSGPISYQVAEAIKGGQLVEARGSALIGVAAANSAVVLGWAITDAAPVSSQAATTDSWGNSVLPVNGPQEYLAVQKIGSVKVVAAATLTFGQPVKAAANGQVTGWVVGTDTESTRVGYVDSPAGIASGASGLIRINL